LKKLIILFGAILLAKEVFFMPDNGKAAQKRLYYLFTHAKKEIKITIYTFTNKTLAKALKKAAKKGVKVEIIADTKEAKYSKSVIPNLALIRHINTYLLSGRGYRSGEKAKMHVKMSIIDNKYLITGSANYSYSAFFKNYEYLVIDTDKDLIKKFSKFFEKIKKRSIPFRLIRIK